MKTKKVSAVLILLIISLIFSGCWDRREIPTLGFVGSMGIDLKSDKIRLTVDVLKPKSIQKTSVTSPTNMFCVTGKSISDAINSSKEKFDLELFHSHTKAYVFGEDFAKDRMESFFDYFNRDYEMRRFVNIFICKGTPAMNIIGVNSGQSDYPDTFLEYLAENTNAYGVESNILKYIQTELEDGIEPVVGVIKLKPKIKVASTAKYDTGKTYPGLDVVIEGAAVFANGKLAGYLNKVETRGYNWIAGNVKETVVTSRASDKSNMYSFTASGEKAKIDVEYDGTRINVKISVNVKGILEEVNGKSDIKNLDSIADIEKQTAVQIQSEISKTLKKVQTDYKSDIFGFGRTLHRTNPTQWNLVKNKWNELFPLAKVTTNIKVTVERTGVGLDTIPKKEIN